MQRDTLPNVALIGFMGTGKSLLGQLLAQRWGWRFVDTDTLVEQQEGLTVAQIFGRFGEEYFREREAEVLRRLEGQRHLIIATGGGVPTRPQNVSSLRQHAIIVLLTAEPEVILQRVQPLAARPKLASASDPLVRIRQLLREREQAYRACADIQVDTSHVTPDEAVQRIEELIEQWKAAHCE
jgi:shikimate kinase